MLILFIIIIAIIIWTNMITIFVNCRKSQLRALRKALDDPHDLFQRGPKRLQKMS